LIDIFAGGFLAASSDVFQKVVVDYGVALVVGLELDPCASKIGKYLLLSVRGSQLLDHSGVFDKGVVIFRCGFGVGGQNPEDVELYRLVLVLLCNLEQLPGCLFIPGYGILRSYQVLGEVHDVVQQKHLLLVVGCLAQYFVQAVCQSLVVHVLRRCRRSAEQGSKQCSGNGGNYLEKGFHV